MKLQWSKLLPLREEKIKEISLDNVEGVFRVSRKEDDGKYYVIFIGSSTSLGKELENLISQKDENFLKQGGDFAFRYAPIEGEEIRKAIEKQMYKQYVPQFNQSEPQSTLEIRANLN